MFLAVLIVAAAMGCGGKMMIASNAPIGTHINDVLKNVGAPDVDAPCPEHYRRHEICASSSVRVLEYYQTGYQLLRLVGAIDFSAAILCVDAGGRVVDKSVSF